MVGVHRLLDRVFLRFLGLPRAFGVRTELLDPASEAFTTGLKS